MFRTLLRTLPSISGNVKLNCNLELDYTYNNKVIYTKVGKSFLTVADHDKNSYVYNVNLLNSRWDYDISKFYSFYSNVFFKSQFVFDKKDCQKLNKYDTIKQRDTDFEFGVSRIQYKVYGKQLSFFAPIYVDNILDLPNQFEIELKYVHNNREITKKIIVPIRPENYIGLYNTDNQFYNYLYRYIKEIDSKIVFLNNGKIKYYGINLLKGGLTESESPSIAMQLNNRFYPIQKVDSLITSGFQQLKMCSKQILPLAFNFDLNDLLSSVEIGKIFLNEISIYGGYKYTDGDRHELKNVALPIYDFFIDPDKLYIDYLTVDRTNLKLKLSKDKYLNILNSDEPGLHESHFYKYQFSNRISPNYTKWRIQKSNLENDSIFDKQDYLINFNNLFDTNNDYFLTQLQNYSLKSISGSCSSFALTDNISVDNLVLPTYSYSYIDINNDKRHDSYSNSYYDNSDTLMYWDNLTNGLYHHFNLIYPSKEYLSYSISYFSYSDWIQNRINNIIEDCEFVSDEGFNTSIFDKTNKKYNTFWHTPVNDSVFYNGILYDFSNLECASYSKYLTDIDNRSKYTSISYNNNIIDYLNYNNYDNWKKTQKITKFGAFILPLPSVNVKNDIYSVQNTFSTSDKGVSVNVVNDDLSNTYNPYFDIDDLKNNYFSIELNQNYGRAGTTFNEIDFGAKSYYNINYKSYYFNFRDFNDNFLCSYMESIKKFYSNEYTFVSDIVTDNVMSYVKIINNLVKENNEFSSLVSVDIDNTIGVSYNCVFDFEKLKSKLDSDTVKKEEFLSYVETTDKGLKFFDEQIYESLYDNCRDYFLETATLYTPFVFMGSEGLKHNYLKNIKQNISSLIENAYVFIGETNIKNLIDESSRTLNSSYVLNNLYAKNDQSDSEYQQVRFYNQNNVIDSSINVNNSKLYFKGDLCLKDDIKDVIQQIDVNLTDIKISNILKSSGTGDETILMNEECQSKFQKIFDWLVKDNGKNIVWLFDIDDPSSLTVDYQKYSRNIGMYLNDRIFKMTKKYLDNLRIEYDNQITKLVSDLSNISSSFDLVGSVITDVITSKDYYNFTPVLQINKSDIAKDVFVMEVKDSERDFFGEPNMCWVDTLNIKNSSLSDAPQKFYSMFLSVSHIKRYIELMCSSPNGLKVYQKNDLTNSKSINAKEWISIKLNQTYVIDHETYVGGPFYNLFIVEKHLVYDDESNTYISKYQYISFATWLKKQIIAKYKYTETQIEQKIWNDIDLDKFYECLTYKYDENDEVSKFSFNYTFDNDRNINVEIEETGLCIVYKGEFIPLSAIQMEDEYQIFDSNGNLKNDINYSISKKNYFINYLYSNYDFDRNNSFNRNNIIINKNECDSESDWSSIGVLCPIYDSSMTDLYHITISESLMNNIKSFKHDGENYYKFDANYNYNNFVQLTESVWEQIKKFINQTDISFDLTKIPIYVKYDEETVLIAPDYNLTSKYDEFKLLSQYKLYTYYNEGENYGFYLIPIKVSSNLISNLYTVTDPDSGVKIKTSKFLSVNHVPLVNIDKNSLTINIDGALNMCSETINLLNYNTNVVNDILANLPLRKNTEAIKILNNLYAKKLNTTLNTAEYDIYETDELTHTINLNRYLHYVEPAFQKVKTENLDYIYNIKFKNTDDNVINKSIYNSIGDTPIESLSYIDHHVNVYGYGISSKSYYNNLNLSYSNIVNNDLYYNNIINQFTPYEYHDFEYNKYFILPHKIVFPLEEKYDYENLSIICNDDSRFNRFIKYCEDFKGIIDRNLILFLYRCYNSNLEFIADGLDEYSSKKVYTGKFIFTLK
jgi:hypothetical protein